MQESIDSTRMGVNRTGMQTSPKHSQEMLDSMDAVPSEALDGQSLATVRMEYIEEADPLGSVPPPGTLKGVAKSGVQMLTGNRPQAFIDKLAERLAFERGGARLYDAVLTKFQAHSEELNNVTADDVLEIRNDEASHARLIQECLETLGADPTAQTPCADLVGVQTMGLIQAATDPRTSLAQTLSCALAAELVDNAGWENLIELARKMGQDEMAQRFTAALQSENDHLMKVKQWYRALTLETTELM
ncbi:MAG: ferritin-like domain-containing protein [Povalibacter sp.]